ncbi:transmembrane protein 70, mitochondrial [Salarias fasciatus]|uniref:Transmembrane protein 70 n=1 Tax=Salarias fasciatus TaxID=181472 RepID=A0A672HRS3_SALFA|nr:transmembrane protein 70, mitochondrial [Salarias fasciatus]
MFCTQLLHGLKHPCVSRSCANIQVAVLRHAAQHSVRSLTGVKPLRAWGRSPRTLKQPPVSLAARWLWSAAPPEGGNLIYTGSLGTAVRGVKLFSYGTSGTSLVLMPQILLKTGIGVDNVALQVAFCTLIGIFTFLTPLLLHLFTKGYVLRLYHHPDRDAYTAVTYSAFLTETRSVFHQSQVRIPAVSKMFTTFYGNNRAFLVNPDHFAFPHDYNHLMGYDKPFSFSQEDVDQPDRS